MIVVVNGNNLDITDNANAAELIKQLGYQDQRIALEVNESIISKSKHGDFFLSDGDKIEIIKAVGGG